MSCSIVAVCTYYLMLSASSGSLLRPNMHRTSKQERIVEAPRPRRKSDNACVSMDGESGTRAGHFPYMYMSHRSKNESQHDNACDLARERY